MRNLIIALAFVNFFYVGSCFANSGALSRRCSELKDPKACIQLGNSLLSSDLSLALISYGKACDLKDPVGCYAAAEFQYGKAKNPEKAFFYAKKGCLLERPFKSRKSKEYYIKAL